mgnify:CR=1 FL=1
MYKRQNVYSQTEQEEILKKYSKADQKKLFVTKPIYQRALIVAAGPFANFILAIVIFSLIYMFVGKDFTPAKIEEVAIIHGANKFYCFFSITVPQMLPSIITGITLAFARCLAEFGATITFVSNIPGETRTLSLALYTVSSIPGTDYIALRLVIISILLAFFAVGISETLNRRSLKKSRGID